MGKRRKVKHTHAAATVGDGVLCREFSDHVPMPHPGRITCPSCVRKLFKRAQLANYLRANGYTWDNAPEPRVKVPEYDKRQLRLGEQA